MGVHEVCGAVYGVDYEDWTGGDVAGGGGGFFAEETGGGVLGLVRNGLRGEGWCGGGDRAYA